MSFEKNDYFRKTMIMFEKNDYFRSDTTKLVHHSRSLATLEPRLGRNFIKKVAN